MNSHQSPVISRQLSVASYQSPVISRRSLVERTNAWRMALTARVFTCVARGLSPAPHLQPLRESVGQLHYEAPSRAAFEQRVEGHRQIVE